MKDLLKTLTIILTTALLIWAIGYTIPKIVDVVNKPDVIKTDTLLQTDTLYFETKKTDSIPTFVYETITKRDTLYLHDKDSNIMIPRQIILKKKEYSDTLQMGQDTLLFTASVTGRSYEYEDLPKLDSISFILRGYNVKEKETITNTIIKRQKGLKVAPAIGVGYGVINRKPDIWAGISISYNF